MLLPLAMIFKILLQSMILNDPATKYVLPNASIAGAVISSSCSCKILEYRCARLYEAQCT